jgi:hypothetical protein
MTIQQIRFQHQALQRYKRRIENIELSPTDAVDAAEAAVRLERRILARWSVLFSAFLYRIRD